MCEVRVCLLACAGGGWGATHIRLCPIPNRTEALACQPSSFTASSWGSRATRRGSRARLAASRQMAIVSGCTRWARGDRGTGEEASAAWEKGADITPSGMTSGPVQAAADQNK